MESVYLKTSSITLKRHTFKFSNLLLCNFAAKNSSTQVLSYLPLSYSLVNTKFTGEHNSIFLPELVNSPVV